VTRFELFDRIRSLLLEQERMRKRTAEFKAWLEKEESTWHKLIAAYESVCAKHYGLVLCSWLDWLDKKGLAFRGEIKWQIPTKGPMTFTPPSTDGLMKEIGKILGELDLEESVRRSALLSAAPIQKTPGASGRKQERSLTVRKSTSGGTT
jgi:hypothetical protein